MVGRAVATIRSGNRSRPIHAVSRSEFTAEEGMAARCEMDSHADTCVAGPSFLVLEFTGEQCDVTTYTNDYEQITNVSVVNAARHILTNRQERLWFCNLTKYCGAVSEAYGDEPNQPQSVTTLRYYSIGPLYR